MSSARRRARRGRSGGGDRRRSRRAAAATARRRSDRLTTTGSRDDPIPVEASRGPYCMRRPDEGLARVRAGFRPRAVAARVSWRICTLRGANVTGFGRITNSPRANFSHHFRSWSRQHLWASLKPASQETDPKVANSGLGDPSRPLTQRAVAAEGDRIVRRRQTYIVRVFVLRSSAPRSRGSPHGRVLFGTVRD